MTEGFIYFINYMFDHCYMDMLVIDLLSNLYIVQFPLVPQSLFIHFVRQHLNSAIGMVSFFLNL